MSQRRCGRCCARGVERRRRLAARAGLGGDPGKWKASFAPLLPGTNAVVRGSSLALDSSGARALAYWMKAAAGNTWILWFWRPESDQAVRVTGSGMTGYPPDGVLLVFAGM